LDTDELAAFRSQWKEELGLAPTSGETEERQPVLADKKIDEDQASSSLSARADHGAQEGSPVKPAGVREDSKDEVS